MWEFVWSNTWPVIPHSNYDLPRFLPGGDAYFTCSIGASVDQQVAQDHFDAWPIQVQIWKLFWQRDRKRVNLIIKLLECLLKQFPKLSGTSMQQQDASFYSR